MGWGLGSLIRAAAGAAGGAIDVVGAVAGGAGAGIGAALGTIEKVNEAVGGAVGMATPRMAAMMGVNSLRTMGNVLSRARVTISSKVHFEQIQYPSYGDADIWGIAASLGGTAGKLGGTKAFGAEGLGAIATSNPYGKNGAMSMGAKQAIGMLSKGGGKGVAAAMTMQKWGIANIMSAPKTKTPGSLKALKSASWSGTKMIREHRNLDITEQIDGFEKFTTAAAFGGKSAKKFM